MKWTKQLSGYIAMIAASVAIWVSLDVSGMLDGLKEEALRWRYLIRGEVPSTAPVVFVDVDAKTVAAMGDRPWDRLNFAQTLDALLGPGRARAVCVDIIFSSFGTGSLLDVDRARTGDWRLGKIVEKYSDKLVLAAAYTGVYQQEELQGIEGLPLKRAGFSDPADVPFPEAPTFPIIKFDSGRLGLANVDEELNEGAVPRKLAAIFDIDGSGFSLHLINGQLRTYIDSLNEPELIEKDGFFQIVDQDGLELEPIPAQSSRRLFTLGLETFLSVHGLDGEDVEWAEDSLIIRKDSSVFREIPLIQKQTMEANWLQGWDVERSETHYSMAEVLEAAHKLGRAAGEGNAEEIRRQEEWFEQFHGKVVFIGAVDVNLKDLAPTPFSRAPVPKVGLHANVYRTIEEEAYVTGVDGNAAHAITLFLAILVAGLIVCEGRGRALTRMASGFVLLGYAGLVFYFFSRSGLLLPVIAPLGASVSAAFLVVSFKLGFEERQRRRIKNMFGAYVSPSLVEEMVESEGDPELGGTEVQITALFSDVEKFSTVSEKLSPNDLVALMNEYLGAMTETFQNQHGALDKYMGDAIVTMFGMPFPIEDHAARACRSAILMQERHAALRKQWSESGKWPEGIENMRQRIGINTGQAIIGNMGSEMRFNYTMMGDSVNLAARCESGAKSYGVYIMITEDTLKAAIDFGEDNLDYRKLDRIVVKGRSEPVDIYELWDGTVDQEKIELCRPAYESALKRYFNGEWETALQEFEACVAHEPSRAFAPTTPSEVLAARCREFISQGTPENWDGVYRMTTK